jgi:hypothetical protein
MATAIVYLFIRPSFYPAGLGLCATYYVDIYLQTSNCTRGYSNSPCGDGIEYFHRNPACGGRPQGGEPSARGCCWAALFMVDINAVNMTVQVRASLMRQ